LLTVTLTLRLHGALPNMPSRRGTDIITVITSNFHL